MAKEIRKEIIDRVKKNKYYSIQLVCTPDKS
jgi:hypothetical protein